MTRLYNEEGIQHTNSRIRYIGRAGTYFDGLDKKGVADRQRRGDVVRGKERMTGAQIEDSLRTRAEKKVRNKTGLLWLLYNVGSYVLINAALITIWILSDSDHPWFLWVMVVWAGGLAFHFAGYIVGFRYGASRERMIEEQVEAFRKKKGMAPVPGPEPEAAPPEPAVAGPESTESE